MTHYDIAIENGIIVTVDSNHTILDKGTLLVKDGIIKKIYTTENNRQDYVAAKTINASNKLVMPGLVNAHTHIPMTIYRGFADDMPLQKWLHDYIFPAEQKFSTKENILIGAELAAAEMIRSGTTCFCDMYFFEAEIATLISKIGMRAVLSEGLFDFPSPNCKTPKDGINYAIKLFDKWNKHPFIDIAFCLHAPYTCSKELILEVKKLSTEKKALLNIHIAESEWEYNHFIKTERCTPVEYLDKLGVIDNKLIAAHCVHVSDSDIELLANKKVGIAHNPECNMKLASGAAPIPKLLDANANIGLGTDGVASNNNHDLFQEMRTAALLHKFNSNDSTVATATQIIEMATIGSAKVLHLDDKIGSLEVGKQADIIIVDLTQPHAKPLYNVYSQIVYSLSGSDVETSIVAGKILMENRKLKTINYNLLKTRVETLANIIRAYLSFF